MGRNNRYKDWKNANLLFKRRRLKSKFAFVGFRKFPLQAVPNLKARSLPEGVKLSVFLTLAWMSVLLATFTRLWTQFFLANKSKFDKKSTETEAWNLRNSRWSQRAVMRFKTGVYAWRTYVVWSISSALEVAIIPNFHLNLKSLWHHGIFLC